MKSLIYREMPASTIEWMRHQFGQYSITFVNTPEDAMFRGFSGKVTHFELIGWGRSHREAELSAEANLLRRRNGK